MSGTIFDRDNQIQAPISGYVPPQPVINPAVFAQNMAPYYMPDMGQGVSQFLTGNLAIPMQFGVDLPAYESMQFSPGDFASFMAAQSKGTAKKPIIPVFNPATGTYSGVQAPGTP